MSEITLPSRHRIRNSNLGGLEAEHATSRSRRLPTILSFTNRWGRNILHTAGTGKRTPNSSVKGSGANHFPRAPAHCEGGIAVAIHTYIQWKYVAFFLVRKGLILVQYEIYCESLYTLSTQCTNYEFSRYHFLLISSIIMYLLCIRFISQRFGRSQIEGYKMNFILKVKSRPRFSRKE